MPSPLRREAYVEGHSIIGPDGDPEGWKRLEDVTIKGILFDAKEVEVKYGVSTRIDRTCPPLTTLPVCDCHAALLRYRVFHPSPLYFNVCKRSST
jgi:hypothetical protein